MTTQPEPARETYAKAHANTSGPSHTGQTSTEVQAMLDEIDELRRWKADVIGVPDKCSNCGELLTTERPDRHEHGLRRCVGLKANSVTGDVYASRGYPA